MAKKVSSARKRNKKQAENSACFFMHNIDAQLLLFRKN